MRSYNIELPRGVVVDVFNLPDDFEERIIKSFKDYTAEMEKEYRYRDKLTYIDCCVQHLNGDNKNPYDIVNDIVENRILYEWREYREIIKESDVYCVDFGYDCYQKGEENAKLYSHFGSDDHYIYDQIQQVLVKVITIVMNYRD